ncbi:MAG: type II toxin-antitoxin system death-on-curing family toxin [Blastocatellia bacterium]|jgi:death-on-curing protein|nr:type II toxin-antitoxin system death-on-curing family toxin [Blastocatellia bacterium]
MNEPRWIDRRALLLLHAEGLAEHGGPEGVRDAGLLESALDRPRNLAAYEPESDLARLAACYAVGIARNHPFVDGNKRAAFLSLGLFLALNGQRLVADKVDAVRVMIDVAAGSMDEITLAVWIRANSRAVIRE